jgi:hypothetical protein
MIMRISHEYNFLSISIQKTGTKTIRDTLDQIDNVILSNVDPKSPYYQHVTAQRLKEEFDDKGWVWDDYFKFTFVRNPWAREVSMYSYKQKMAHEWKHGLAKFSKKIPTDLIQGKNCNEFIKKHPTLKDAIMKTHITSQYDFIYDKNGKQLIDFIGKLENLQEDFNTICDKIGIPKQKLPHRNKTKHKHYTEYYDDETRSIVAEKYAKDIEYFGYEFGE